MQLPAPAARGRGEQSAHPALGAAVVDDHGGTGAQDPVQPPVVRGAHHRAVHRVREGGGHPALPALTGVLGVDGPALRRGPFDQRALAAAGEAGDHDDVALGEAEPPRSAQRRAAQVAYEAEAAVRRLPALARAAPLRRHRVHGSRRRHHSESPHSVRLPRIGSPGPLPTECKETVIGMSGSAPDTRMGVRTFGPPPPISDMACNDVRHLDQLHTGRLNPRGRVPARRKAVRGRRRSKNLP